jgi:hypothetical protein
MRSEISSAMLEIMVFPHPLTRRRRFPEFAFDKAGQTV